VDRSGILADANYQIFTRDGAVPVLWATGGHEHSVPSHRHVSPRSQTEEPSPATCEETNRLLSAAINEEVQVVPQPRAAGLSCL